MKIAILGTGGVGGYFGGLLARAGHDVTFIARGAHLQAIQQNGLQIISVNGDFTIAPAQATADPAAVGPVDYVIVAVKHYHLADAAPALLPLVGENTTVVPLLNGVDAPDILIEHLGAGPVVGGLCSLVAMIEAPGVIRQASHLRRVVVGELDHSPSERLAQLVRVWADQGAEAVLAGDIQAAMWSKFLFIASFGGVSSLARAPIGEIRAEPATRALLVDAIREAEQLARAGGVALDPQAVEKAMGLVDNFEPGATSSMQRDVIAGHRFELEAFSGKIVRLGEQLGVPTPVHRAIYALLRPALLRA